MAKKNFWVYTEDDEAGTVQEGETEHEAVVAAIKLGWEPDGFDVTVVELGKSVGLGKFEGHGVCHVCNDYFSPRTRCDCEAEVPE